MQNSILDRSATRRSFSVLAATAIFTMAFSPSQALAATLWSTSSSHSDQGVRFTYQSGLDTGSPVKAHTTIRASQSVPAGTMYAQACIVKGLDLAIIASSAATSNKTKTASLTATVSLNRLAAGYRSKGKVKTYSSGWRSCTSTAVGYSLSSDLPMNGSGQTYGTYGDVEAGAIPDLIAIVADSGLEGYALYEQFSAVDAPDAIPVYDVEGTTLIGMFTFGDK